jgi:hypothetical protein
MGITIPSSKLRLVLERAVRLAESDEEVPELWLERTQRIADCPAQTYVAALGTALLAKAAEAKIDALTIKSKAAPNAYSMRGVAKVLAEHAPDYGYHLGVTRGEPLNNQPWFGSSRIDRFANVRADVLPYHQDMVRYLSDLNRLSEDEALRALAAFLRLRVAHGRDQRARAGQLTVSATGAPVANVIEVVELFVREDPEGGRRGQALVAALFDLADDDAELGAINDPRSFDVTIREGGVETLGVDVKQKAVEESAVIQLASEAAQREVDKVLLVALSPNQRPLDRARVAEVAQAEHGVLAVVLEGAREVMAQLALQSPLSAREFARQLPERYLRRMQEHGVSPEGQQYWADLCSGLGAG